MAYDLDMYVAMDLKGVFFRAHFDPTSVRRVVAGYSEGSPMFVRVGVVVELASGQFAYAFIGDDVPTRTYSAVTQFFNSEPTHLYARTNPWLDEAKINAVNKTLGYAKTAAKYGALGDSGHYSDSEAVARFDAESPAVGRTSLSGANA